MDDVKDPWKNLIPRHISFPLADGTSIITSLLLSHERIITASDDHAIHVYSLETGKLLRILKGHDGGVWTLAVFKDTLVSGSSDHTLRVWDLSTGRCTHTFRGHTATVRCVTIVKPEWVDVEVDGVIWKEKWPKDPLIVSGSRDKSLRVWTLPHPGGKEYHSVMIADSNPFHKLHLVGHTGSIRSLSARGRTIVTGSYDNTVRVWDAITGMCKWVLLGHTNRVYNAIFDPSRSQAYSSSQDTSVRIWDLKTGQCQHTLTGHVHLVGLLALSPSYLISSASDSTLRIWDPNTGELRHSLIGNTTSVSCFYHDDTKLLSGNNDSLTLWDIRTGAHVKDLLTGITKVWQVAFQGRWCVAASIRDGTTMMDIWDLGEDHASSGDESSDEEDD